MSRSANELVRLGALAAARGMSMVKVSRMFAKEKDRPTLIERADFIAGYKGIKQAKSPTELVVDQLSVFVSGNQS